ncbi:MAG: Ig-like domain-containing protein, partial [Candidatus Omnitrophica bacterium]|nr:Ig-like domain-containing protein [Candidatus Omnitrophota bacterium]
DAGETVQLEAHGKEQLVWMASDESVGKVDSNGLFTAVGKGTCTVTVTDALGNMATSGAIIVQ